ncbi:MAG: pilus assembly protein [Chloroflexi bacterium]|nr:pilus assembly protein [Chloroflexota bacterium]
MRGGQSLVEFALILPVLLLVLFGVFDFGRAIYAYNAVSNAAREGGRTAIVNQTASDIRARAAAQATALGIDATSTSCPPSGPSGVCVEFKNAALTSACTPANLGCVAVITVKYSITPLTPIVGSIVGPLTISSTTKQAVESLCTTGGSVTCPIP